MTDTEVGLQLLVLLRQQATRTGLGAEGVQEDGVLGAELQRQDALGKLP